MVRCEVLFSFLDLLKTRLAEPDVDMIVSVRGVGSGEGCTRERGRRKGGVCVCVEGGGEDALRDLQMHFEHLLHNYVSTPPSSSMLVLFF